MLHARIASAARGGWSAERGGFVACGGVRLWRLSALTRRYVGVDDGFVNCGAAKGCVPPVIAPAEGIVRAGAVLRGGDAALARGAAFVLCRSCVFIGMSCARSRRSYVPVEMSCVRLMSVVRFYWDVLAFVLRPSYVPIGMSYVRSRLLFAACAPNRTACDMFRFCSAVGRDRR